jgi:four helix bundle protein
MARRVQELECWRLADELRTEVHAICALEKVKPWRRFCEGFTEAAGSVCRNISEGFGRFQSAPIVQFFNYSLASLDEVEDYLRECLSREFIGAEQYVKDVDLAEHARATTLRFKRYHEAKLHRKPRHTHRRT